MKATRLRAASLASAGFTRTDALALVLVLTLLAAVQLPLPGNNRIHSRTAVCLDNLRRITLAWQSYAGDSEGWFVPNTDTPSAGPGMNWVSGSGGVGGPDEFNHTLLADPGRSMLLPQLGGDSSVFRCPADSRVGIFRAAPDPVVRTEYVPAARSVAMNGAVGTNPQTPFSKFLKTATDGVWLDNSHTHVAGRTWLTYGRESHLTVPGPALTSVILDEDEFSLNDGFFAFGMQAAEWIDWPATRHDNGGTVSFADGHVEWHRWVDPRTRIASSSVVRLRVPNSPDYDWIRERTSALIPR